MDLTGILDGIATFVAFFAILHNCWVIGNIHWASGWIARKRSTPLPNEAQSFVVLLLPMLKEATIVEETIEHFLKLDYPAHLYKVVVVTSARESIFEGTSTAEVIEKVIAVSPSSRILHFKADGNDKSKADQINQALQWLDTISPLWWKDDTILGVYDADSRPELHVLRELDRCVNEYSYACAFQQPAIYMSGYHRLPLGLRGSYLRARPFYNLRFCLFREIPGFYRSVGVNLSKFSLIRAILSSPNHFLGHGEFVRVRTLRKVGNSFPPPSADTSLGTVLSFHGYSIVPLSTFDVGETPDSIKMFIQQGITWYAGCALYHRDFKIAIENGVRLELRHFSMFFKRWLENMIWCIGPILMLLTVCWATWRSSQDLLILCAFGVSLHAFSVVQVFWAYSKFAQTLRGITVNVPNVFQYILTLIFYPIMLMGNCIGPILYYYYRVRQVVAGMPVPRSKTTRLKEYESNK